tara:strand:+ start:348 stop:1172 length:825 start_codon:yes stop_codon:yes gene_type:complete
VTKLAKKLDIAFELSTISPDKINTAAINKVSENLVEFREKTRAFDRGNSQTSLSLMSLTMLTGHSPYRIIRQIMAEVETRKSALVSAQVGHAKLLEKKEKLIGKDDPVSVSKFRQTTFDIDMLESKVNGAFKDIAILMDAYDNVKAVNNIDDWDEAAFEAEEKNFHVRRGFELMYRNLLECGRPQTATIEYTAQYGIHPQVAFKECQIYLEGVSEMIEKGVVLHSNHLEDFLDEMANKYEVFVDATAERLFGKADFTNTDYMLTLDKKTKHTQQ